MSLLRADPRPPVSRATGTWESFTAWLAVAWTGDDPHIRHSRRVALLKRLLPAVGVTLLLLIAIWPRLAPLWERIRFAFPAIDLRDARELDMVNPRYAGVDREGHPFVVTAVSGRQLPDRQDLMSLKAPRADLKTHAGANIVLTAATGIYQQQTQLLDLFGDVVLVHQNGTRFVTQSARVEAAANRAEGDQPVEGHGPSGDIKAQGFRVLDRGDKILFTGRCDMLLRSARTNAGAKAAAPAGLPAPVATAAARTEAEAKPLLAAARPAPGMTRRASTKRPAAAPVSHTAASAGSHQAPGHGTSTVRRTPARRKPASNDGPA